METTIECLKEEVQQVLTTNILPYWIEKMQDRGNGGLRSHHRAGMFGC